MIHIINATNLSLIKRLGGRSRKTPGVLFWDNQKCGVRMLAAAIVARRSKIGHSVKYNSLWENN